jgi:hypothetical protein
MNIQQSRLLSQHLLELLALEPADSEFGTCKKKNCCRKYQKGKKACKKCPEA